jgi:nitroimidazol reductase NimA-like FMN-containing flavoprotein (pyridoxamine 5'-phosphate oxidase superfamily)
VASVRLTDAESWELLERSRVGVFTSLTRDGTPISLPVWFAPLEGRIYLHGPSISKKFTRVRNNPRVSFVCESGERWVELTAVHLTGQARVLSDEYALEESVAAAFDRRYAGLRVEPTAIPQAARDNYRQLSVIEIVPDARILSWDNSRLGLGRQ